MGQYFCQFLRKSIEHFWNFNKALQFVLILQVFFRQYLEKIITFREMCKNIAPWSASSLSRAAVRWREESNKGSQLTGFSGGRDLMKSRITS